MLTRVPTVAVAQSRPWMTAGLVKLDATIDVSDAATKRSRSAHS
jgi:hypothetical protein